MNKRIFFCCSLLTFFGYCYGSEKTFSTHDQLAQQNQILEHENILAAICQASNGKKLTKFLGNLYQVNVTFQAPEKNSNFIEKDLKEIIDNACAAQSNQNILDGQSDNVSKSLTLFDNISATVSFSRNRSCNQYGACLVISKDSAQKLKLEIDNSDD